MGTFVLSFIGNGFVRSAQRTMPFPGAIPSGMRRKLLVLLYFTSIVSCVTLFGVMTIPDIIREAADFVSRLQSDSIWVVVLEKLRQGLGCARLADGLLGGNEKGVGSLKRFHAGGFVVPGHPCYSLLVVVLHTSAGCVQALSCHACRLGQRCM